MRRAVAQPDGRVRGISGGWLEEEEARRLRERGLPVGTETARVLTSDAIRHVWRLHGPDAARAPGELPVTVEDIANWRAFIAAAHDTARTITDARGPQPGREAIAHLARDALGRLVVVEEYRSRTGVLAMATMFRLPEGSGIARLDQVPGMAERMRRAQAAPSMHDARRHAGFPVLTSRTLEGSDAAIPRAAARFNAYTPAGRAVLVEPQVVELGSLIPSHGPDGRPNPSYPHAEGLQPRDRAAGPSQDQVRAIAARLIPERLLPNVEAGAGAPIVAQDLVVESGNGRIAALALVHRDPALAHVREAYLAALARAGFELPSGMAEPVLVSIRRSQLSPAERAAFVREANLRGTAAETLREQAARDAETARAALALWRGGAVGDAANRDFLRAFLARLTPEERTDLLDAAGLPLPALAQRIERALLVAAYGDAFGPVLERLVAGSTEGIRGLAGALRAVAGDWAALRAAIAEGRVPAEYEATPALAEAVGAVVEAQQRRISPADLALQADLERPAMTPAGLAMLRAMYPEGDLTRRIKPEVRLAEMLRGYVERAGQAQAGPGLFGLPPVRPEEAIGIAAQAEEAAAPAEMPPARNDAALPPASAAQSEPPRGAPRAAWPQDFPAVIDHGVNGIRRDPDWAAAKAGDAEAARLLAAEAERTRLAALPETARAELLEARRIAAARDIPVPEEAGAIGARALLDAAEAEAEQAAAAAACLIGAAA